MLNLREPETWTLAAATNVAISFHRYSGIYTHQANVISGTVFSVTQFIKSNRRYAPQFWTIHSYVRKALGFHFKLVVSLIINEYSLFCFNTKLEATIVTRSLFPKCGLV